MKALVVYYSRTGKTHAAAKGIAFALHADLIKLEEIKRRDGIFSFIQCGFEAITRFESELKPMDLSLKGYDTVFLGTPTWAGLPVPALNAYIANVDLNKKKVFIFSTGVSSGNRILDLVRDRIEEKGGIIEGSFSICIKGKKLDEIERDAEMAVKELNI
jgi:flavodoxin